MAHKRLITSVLLCLAVGAAPACLGKRRPKNREQTASGEQAAVKGEHKIVSPDDVDDKLSNLITGERKLVLYDDDDPQKGADQPLVTIVEFSDFECPFCSKLAATLEQAAAQYPEDVRLIFKQFPLGMHKQAEPSARASLAAHEQGKFWEMHDKLFANQRALRTADLEKYAKEIGLDLDKYKARADADEVQKRVNDDMNDARVLEVKSTPTFYINGRLFSGAKPVEAIRSAIEEEKALAKKLLDGGAKRPEIYARIMKAATPGTGEPKKADEQHRRGEASKKPNYAVPLGDDRPSRGPKDALVTIVEFGALAGCEACTKNAKTLDAVLAKNKDIRHVFRNLPPEARGARAAAITGLAAHTEGKFWQIRDKLSGLAGDSTPDDLEKIAGSVGIKPDKFKAHVSNPAIRKTIAQDREVADKFRGTADAPVYFVNGRFVGNDATAEEFEALIKEEREKAAAFMKEKKTKKSELYETMRQGWRGLKQANEVEPSKPGSPDARKP